MHSSLGRITAHLADQENPTPDLVALINRHINPPAPVTEQDIYIRAMYLVSDEINSYGGCFPEDEHPRLASLLIDSPVLVGHRKDTLPIARTFHATCTERDSRHWVKSYFYWLKSSEGSETLRENIDGGIYKECSIGFTYLTPECSICGQDIRTCRHEPMQTYSVSGADQPCHFNYRQIERVLETSLVYRGATPDTVISKELQITKQSPASSLRTPQAITLSHLTDLPPADIYLVTPAYPGLDCRLDYVAPRWSLSRTDGLPLTVAIPPSFHFTDRNTSSHHGRLVAYRGRERCPLPSLEKFLGGQPSGITRLTLYIFPNAPDEHIAPGDDYPHIRLMHHHFATADSITSVAPSLATREGVEIRAVDSAGAAATFHTFRDPSLYSARSGYLLQALHGSDSWLLGIRLNGRHSRYLLRQFNLNRFAKGARFVADRLDRDFRPFLSEDQYVTGQIADFQYSDDGCFATLAAPLKTKIAIRPIKLDGRHRYLIYCTETSTENEITEIVSSLSTEPAPVR